MELNVSGAFIYFTIPIFGGIPVTQTVVSFFLVAVILIGCFPLNKFISVLPNHFHGVEGTNPFPHLKA